LGSGGEIRKKIDCGDEEDFCGVGDAVHGDALAICFDVDLNYLFGWARSFIMGRSSADITEKLRLSSSSSIDLWRQ